MAGVNFRHNVMKVNSLVAFLNINGGYNNYTKDVYFVRGIGEFVNIGNEVLEADRQMDMEMSEGKLRYLRFSLLPQLADIRDSDYYAGLYSDWKTSGKLKSFRNVKISDAFLNIVSDALYMTLDRYENAKPSVTPSMIKNLGTKLLYWFDKTMDKALNGWDEKVCIKIIADNIIKEQEYLYYLFLTFIGCDVFLIENRADVKAPDMLLEYSQKLMFGKFGNTVIMPYSQQHPQVVLPKYSDTHHPAKVVIPQRPSRIKSTAGNTAGNIIVRGERTEKSFEELALLASSIVLIEVHDITGRAVSSGSGIMIGRNGYILTNNHVTSGGRFFSVRIEEDDNRYETDEVIKYNTVTDLAIIRIDRQLNPIPIYNGEKRLARGQKVVAIGSPLGLFNSVSDGIISGFRKTGDDLEMIQFTAPISHGSSGGAVLNMYGELIGISTAGLDDGQNLNLAVGYENIRIFTNGFRG